MRPDGDTALSEVALARTVAVIAAAQEPDGMIPWFPGGHCDPWNHVEAAMALDVGGRTAAAEAAYAWLARTQRTDGAWHQYYLAGGIVEEPTLDANVTAYVATGVWHHLLATGDTRFLAAMWPVVERAIDFVLDLQTPHGEILWARHASGRPASYALLASSASIFHSLRCAIAAGHRLGVERPDWELSAALLASVVGGDRGARAAPPERESQRSFFPKDRWAMDWYYPVLCGVLTGPAARARLRAGRARFVLAGLGTRCVSDHPWVTAAETSECAIAHLVAGDAGTARNLLRWAQHLRHPDGSYFTGMVHPQRVHFPGGERTSYSAAAVVLAADALDRLSPAAGLFLGQALQPVVAIEAGDTAPAAPAGTLAQ